MSPMRKALIRVLVADDSPLDRRSLVAILAADPEVQVAGEAASCAEAVALTKSLRPSVLLVDASLARGGASEAVRPIMIDAPTPIVVVSNAADPRDVENATRALDAGALAVVPRPPAAPAPADDEGAPRFIETVKAMAQVKVVGRWRGRAPAASDAARSAVRARAIAIAASTGGPTALARILSDLPPDLPASLLVVQHIARGFSDGFAAWLGTSGRLPVKHAEDGEPLVPGTVYLAPDDRHLGVTPDGTCVALLRAPPIGGFCPSATHLFASAARAFGPATAAVLLTGMGEDGVEGLRRVRAAGGRIVVQDERSSVVFGMPGAAVAAGLADVTTPLDLIPRQIESLARRGWTPSMLPSPNEER